jgi:phosphocarrier protein HPr
MACETTTESSSPPKQQSEHAMNGEVLRRKVTVQDPLGFHMRPLTVFAQRAGQFQSAVTVAKDDQRVNGKSPLELMLLAAEQGTELTLEVCGPDAQAAIDVLAELLAAPGVDESQEPPSK